MKKFLPIALVLVLLAALGLFVWWRQASPSPEQGSAMMPVPGTATSETGEQGGVIGSIKDAMGLGKKMQCTYTDSTGQSAVATTVFVDGEKFKSESVVDGTTMYSLFDGTTQYAWTSKDKQGWKMSKACLDELATSLPQGTDSPDDQPVPNKDIQKDFDTATNVQCQAAGTADFSMPSDIVFSDQCEMLRNSMKALEQMKGQLPEGMQIPGY